MVAEIAVFDLYYVLVEVIFGSILMSGFAVSLLLLIVGALSKMSPMLIIFISGMFLITFATGYGGAIFSVLALIFSFIYFTIGFFYLIAQRF